MVGAGVFEKWSTKAKTWSYPIVFSTGNYRYEKSDNGCPKVSISFDWSHCCHWFGMKFRHTHTHTVKGFVFTLQSDDHLIRTLKSKRKKKFFLRPSGMKWNVWNMRTNTIVGQTDSLEKEITGEGREGETISWQKPETKTKAICFAFIWRKTNGWQQQTPLHTHTRTIQWRRNQTRLDQTVSQSFRQTNHQLVVKSVSVFDFESKRQREREPFDHETPEVMNDTMYDDWISSKWTKKRMQVRW